ncbi:hypothetical protein [Kibdelosporangium aridum]|uniref:hypothetical protein n=1 Tax=Kibdelosporangium aridum TaxID=2030 RepID=UPI0021ADD09F|nr:hypothetical protein [Kibdelosporangium aridum]
MNVASAVSQDLFDDADSSLRLGTIGRWPDGDVDQKRLLSWWWRQSWAAPVDWAVRLDVVNQIKQ